MAEKNLNIQGATILDNNNLKSDINILAYDTTTLYKLQLSNKTLNIFKELLKNSTGEIFNDYANNQATGNYSHAEGQGTKAIGDCQHVQGKYNIAESSYAHIIGGGTSNNPKNIYTVDWNGKGEYADDVVAYSNTDPIKLSDINNNLKNKQNKISFGEGEPDNSVGSIGDIYCMIIN